ncbi:hypothetical protein TNCV_2358981 [Trichonephila clavipes]|nr:hypothetical protein TNCV_2358981 [Trichonephila clavipes]
MVAIEKRYSRRSTASETHTVKRALHTPFTDCTTGPVIQLGVDDDNGSTTPIKEDKDSLEFFKSSNNMVETDSDDENERSNSAQVSTASEMRHIMKKYAWLDAHSNGKMGLL